MFRQLVLARIIEPTSKLDSLRVLAEAGVDPVPSYATLKRRLPAYAADEFRRELAAACAVHAQLGPASLVLYDVSTLYFETDVGDGFREPGFSKERGIDEQVAKAERAVAGKVPVKRNRFIRLVGADKSVNRTLEAKARALAGWKGYAESRIMPRSIRSALVSDPERTGSLGIIPMSRWMRGSSNQPIAAARRSAGEGLARQSKASMRG